MADLKLGDIFKLAFGIDPSDDDGGKEIVWPPKRKYGILFLLFSVLF